MRKFRVYASSQISGGLDYFIGKPLFVRAYELMQSAKYLHKIPIYVKINHRDGDTYDCDVCFCPSVIDEIETQKAYIEYSPYDVRTIIHPHKYSCDKLELEYPVKVISEDDVNEILNAEL